jgi:hypothetical protein
VWLPPLYALARIWKSGPSGEPRHQPARTEPRPPAITQGDFGHDSCRFRHRLFCAVVVAIVSIAAGSGQVRASSLLAAAGGNSAAGNHRHSCRCADCQGGGSCCCSKPPRSQRVRSAPSIESTPQQFDAGPCVKARHCGDAGLPLPGAPVVIGTSAMSTARAAIDQPANRRWLFHLLKICLPAEILVPLDDPPERARRVDL